MNPLERGHDRPLESTTPIRGEIELRNVCFRYAETERFVLENLNLKVEAGKFVTVMGPSGGGKTTLLKVMLGLLEPTSGEVLIDGIPLATMGVRAYREQVATVMQDELLLSGSISDNICFFDADFDHEKMILCAQMAGVHDEIMAMPMAYNSLIGDMGSSLSGGQKQRVLLARALYKRPKILFSTRGPQTLMSRRSDRSASAFAASTSPASYRPPSGDDERGQFASVYWTRSGLNGRQHCPDRRGR